eukprot:1158375-Pelagomonas_calceolata.AAC.5
MLQVQAVAPWRGCVLRVGKVGGLEANRVSNRQHGMTTEHVMEQLYYLARPASPVLPLALCAAAAAAAKSMQWLLQLRLGYEYK